MLLSSKYTGKLRVSHKCPVNKAEVVVGVSYIKNMDADFIQLFFLSFSPKKVQTGTSSGFKLKWATWKSTYLLVTKALEQQV